MSCVWLDQTLEAYCVVRDTMDDIAKYAESLLESWGLGVVKSAPKKNDSPLYHPFRLPIQHVSEEVVHSLSPIVGNDLELHNMYEFLLQPSNEFGKIMMQEWGKQYTSDATFLRETQEVIQRSGGFHAMTNKSCQQMNKLWKDTKEHPNFLEHYCYLDWQVLVHLNRSSSTMQFLSVANILSPIMSFIMPLLFLVVPFLLLKIQGLPITFDVYVTILKDIARNHFIGKALLSMENISPDKVMYLVFAVGMYGMQMYQNVSVCQRFYHNLVTINEHLIHLRTFLHDSLKNIDTFTSLNGHLTTYQNFCREAQRHANVIRQFERELQPIRNFEWDIQKPFEIGYMLKSFYEVHSNQTYEESIRWCMGFEGYLDNLRGIGRNSVDGLIHTVTIHTPNNPVPTTFQDQVYPAIAGTGSAVSNTCSLDKNMILTGPNASGKTTLLKTTMINIIFAQQCGYAYCSSADITPYTHIHSYLNIPDTSERDSLFQAEARRCKDILDMIVDAGTEARHFCIFDELYSGTNPLEASKAAHAFMIYLSQYEHVHVMLTTHYTNICKRIQQSSQIRKLRNMKMKVNKTENGHFCYTYQIVSGISKVQGAIQVLENLCYPPDILSEFTKGNS